MIIIIIIIIVIIIMIIIIMIIIIIVVIIIIINIDIHTHVYTYIHTYIHAYIHTYIHTHIHTYINIYVCIHICIYVSGCIHIGYVSHIMCMCCCLAAIMCKEPHRCRANQQQHHTSSITAEYPPSTPNSCETKPPSLTPESHLESNSTRRRGQQNRWLQAFPRKRCEGVFHGGGFLNRMA